MEWPKKLTVKVCSIDKKRSFKKLVLYILISATHKNDYTLGPLFTDENGEVVITKKTVEKEISKTYDESPMDYTDTLNECRSQVTIEIESKTSLQERWQRLSEFYPKEAEYLMAIINGNTNFIPVQVRRQVEVNGETKTINIDIT